MQECLTLLSALRDIYECETAWESAAVAMHSGSVIT